MSRTPRTHRSHLISRISPPAPCAPPPPPTLSLLQPGHGRTSNRGGQGTEEKLFKALLQLRQACCHPCIGSGGIGNTSGGSRLGKLWGPAAGSGGRARWLSMDQILDRCVRLTSNGPNSGEAGAMPSVRMLYSSNQAGERPTVV